MIQDRRVPSQMKRMGGVSPECTLTCRVGNQLANQLSVFPFIVCLDELLCCLPIPVESVTTDSLHAIPKVFSQIDMFVCLCCSLITVCKVASLIYFCMSAFCGVCLLFLFFKLCTALLSMGLDAPHLVRPPPGQPGPQTLPPEGPCGQRFQRTADGWALIRHRTVPWGKVAAAPAVLRCDGRGCVALSTVATTSYPTPGDD